MIDTDITQILRSNLEGLSQLSHLLVIVFGAVLLLVVGLFTNRKSLVGAMYCLPLLASLYFISFRIETLFGGQIVTGPVASSVQLIAIVTCLLLVLYPRFLSRPMEVQFLVLALLVGSLLMTVAKHLLLIYLSIELASLAAYLLTAFTFKKGAFEGSLKYLLTGVVSSAIMIYGISILYGTSGSLMLEDLQINSPWGLAGAFLFAIGILFKVSVFPMHVWVPNTYVAAPIEIVALMAVVPKICGFLLLGNFVLSLEHELINQVLMLLALATVVLGSFAAILQSEAKRLLAYGAVAHSGLMLPLVIVSGENQGAFLFYALIYAIMNLGVFYFIAIHDNNDEALTLDRLKGLGKPYGLLGASVLVILMALVGLPPTSGFSIKLTLFSEVWVNYAEGGNRVVYLFFIVGILSTAVSLFYYLRIPYYYFLKESTEPWFAIKKHQVWVTTFFALLLLWFFIEPDIFDNFVSTMSKP